MHPSLPDMRKVANKPRHAAMTQFAVVDGCLEIGGMPLPELVRQIGQTPFYAYDRAAIDRRVEALRTALPTDVAIHYAIKANPMKAVVQHLSETVDGLDVASAGELELALETTIPASKISFAGPGKRREELQAALSAGVLINVESENELETILDLARGSPSRPQIGLRVNPDFELKTSGLKMSGGPKPFGIDAQRAPALLRRLDGLQLDLLGLHIFCGSQCLSAEALADAHEQTFGLAYQLAAYAPAGLKTLNIGGGLGIPYFPGDTPLDLSKAGENLEALMIEARRRLPGTEIIMELGRYLVGEAGVYVCRILDRKFSHGQLFLITDGGLHHHLAASGNFGQVVRKNYPVIVGNKVNFPKREIATVVGPLCTPLDVIAERMEFPETEIGDLIVVLQSGAYGLSASPIGFLNHPPPDEVLV